MALGLSRKDISKKRANCSNRGNNDGRVQHDLIVCTLQRNWKFMAQDEKSCNEWCAVFEALSQAQKPGHKRIIVERQFEIHSVSSEQPITNRDDSDETITKGIESPINKKLIAMMNDLSIPENAREKMLQLDQTKKIQIIEQHLFTKIERVRTYSKDNTKSLHIPSDHVNTHVQSKTMQNKGRTVHKSMFGDRHNLIVMVLINACKTRIKTIEKDEEIVSFVDEVFEEVKEAEFEEESRSVVARLDMLVALFEQQKNKQMDVSIGSHDIVCDMDSVHPIYVGEEMGGRSYTSLICVVIEIHIAEPQSKDIFNWHR
eukprot:899709_1